METGSGDMPTTILTTKLHAPPARGELVSRPRLLKSMDTGLDRKLLLISAPAGFGKTTLVSEWTRSLGADTARPVTTAWLSLDQGDSDPVRFLTYLTAALQTINEDIGSAVLRRLQSPQPPSPEPALTNLLNDIAASPDEIVLVLDDYHLIDARSVDQALAFLLEHQPTKMHLVIITREDPALPLARWRVRDQLTEVRAAGLRFTSTEAAEFLGKVARLDLEPEQIAALETRTEGWIAGLQLAALSLRGRSDVDRFIASFTGSNRFVLDYLVEEVLAQQAEHIERFLLQTAVLDRLSGSLCDAVTGRNDGQETLAHLEQANLFLVSLDDERRWYRYHHLFADLLRQRLSHGIKAGLLEGVPNPAELHCRASGWYEVNGYDVEAFRHAAAAGDVDRAARLMEGGGMPLQYRGAMAPVLSWLASLPAAELDARPSLWVAFASASAIVGQEIRLVEEKLRAAERALAGTNLGGEAQDLVGRVATVRAMLAIPNNDAGAIAVQSRRALDLLDADNVPDRTTAMWTLGFAHQLRGDRAAAQRAYLDVLPISDASGNVMMAIAAATSIGQISESCLQIREASAAYRRVIELAGDPPLPAACEAYLGLARIAYEADDLATAEQHCLRSLDLAQEMENVDAPAMCRIQLARLSLARGDTAGAIEGLAEAEAFLTQGGFTHRMPELARVRVVTLLRLGDVAGAAEIAEGHGPPDSRAKVRLAKDDAIAALDILAPALERAVDKAWPDERLRYLVLQAMARDAAGHPEGARRALTDALDLATDGGCVRTFLDEGPPMARLLYELATELPAPAFVAELLYAFGHHPITLAEDHGHPSTPSPPSVVEQLSERELEVLSLIAQGLTNRQIAAQLYITLSTVKGHNRRIYGKLGVQRRTEAVARARALGLI